RTLQDLQFFPPPVQQNPTQPTGGPLPPVQRATDLPKPGPVGPEGQGLHLIKAKHPEWDGPQLHVTDGIEFTDNGYHCWADEMTGNQDTNVYTLKGNVRIFGEAESIYGETVQVDFNAKTFVAEDSESTLKPSLVKGYVRDNLYVKAGRASGSQQE